MAFLGIENLGTSAEFAGVEEAIDEELLRGLQGISGLSVIGPNQVQAYAVLDLEPLELARQLGVARLVMGHVYENDQGLHISVQQVDALDGNTSTSAGLVMSSPSIAELDRLLPQIVTTAVEGARIGMLTREEIDELRSPQDARAIVLDASLDGERRLRAFSRLRPHAGERTDAVITAVAQIASYSQDWHMRRSAWLALANTDDISLVAPLLQSLGFDPHSSVRLVVAELLAGYLGEPGVREALVSASLTDESADVREHVALLLLPDSERRSLRRREVLDETLPDEERFAALVDLSGAGRLAGGTLVEVDHDVAIAAIELALTSSNPRLRADIWTYLAVEDERLRVDALLTQLANDPAESVRERAADNLRPHLEYSDVRDALNDSSNNDPSLAVRRRAENVLDSR